MKYITLIIGLLVMGCDGHYAGNEGEFFHDSGTRKRLEKQDLLKRSVLGSYEYKFDNGESVKLVILENQYSCIGKIVYVRLNRVITNQVITNQVYTVFKIEPSGDLTEIAHCSELFGKRIDLPKEERRTFIKTK